MLREGVSNKVMTERGLYEIREEATQVGTCLCSSTRIYAP